jgi:hypothetical protein
MRQITESASPVTGWSQMCHRATEIVLRKSSSRATASAVA